jgi:bifunctional non-homologous end joining protein LigD
MQRRTVVVGGWKAGNGQRRELGALLIGVPEPQGLRYLGAVGSGFTTTQLRHLTRTLPRLHQEPCPFTPPPPPAVVRQARWVRPCLIGEVTYLHTTAAGHLRHPVWKGLIDGVYHLAPGTAQSFPDAPQATVSAAPDPAGPHPTSKPG